MSEDTVFHKIMRREIPADILFEDEDLIVIRDIQAVSDTHLLLIPKQSIASLRETQPEHDAVLGKMLRCAAQLAVEQGISDDGYRVVINTGTHGGQTVFQLHMHLLGGRQFDWPPG